MLKKERQKKILALINKNDYMTIPELAKRLSVSDMTIRRDVTELAQQQLLTKLYGGAQKIEKLTKELATSEKINAKVAEKQYIGKVMNRLIPNNSTIFIGAGTTTLYALPEIKRENLFIVTNSLLAFNYVIQKTDYRVFLTAGEFSRTTEEFYGEVAEKSLANLNIDLAFASTNGIFEDNVTTANSAEGAIQRAAFERSKKKCIVADSSKFNRSDIYTFTRLSEMDYLITDHHLAEQLFDHYKQYTNIIKEE